MESATIQISDSSCFGECDFVCFTTYETRWWKKILNLIFNRSNAIQSKPFAIGSVDTGTSISIYNDVEDGE